MLDEILGSTEVPALVRTAQEIGIGGEAGAIGACRARGLTRWEGTKQAFFEDAI